MTRQISVWESEHQNFNRLLDLLETQISQFHEGARPDYDLMGSIVHYLRYYPDTYHHPKEDEAIARLAKRDPALRLKARRLAGEHEIIATSGKQLLGQLDAAISGAFVSRGLVEASCASYVAYYRQHMAREEAELFPNAERTLGKEDWAAVEAAFPAAPDPLFGDTAQDCYRDLKRQITSVAGCGCEASTGR